MSGTGYPSGFPNSVGNHQQNFSNQINNPMRNQLMNMNMGMPNQMGMMNYNQPGIIHQQQQSQPIQNTSMGLAQSNLGNVGLPSPSHNTQQQQQQSQVSQQLQQSSQLQLQTSSSSSAGTVSSLITSQQQNVVSQQQSTMNTNIAVVSQQQQQQPLPQKEFNIVSLCRFGQETVQDILSRFQEVFAALKSVQPPNNANPMQAASATTEKKVTEQFRTIRLLFKRLRLLFDKCNDSCQQDLGMEYTHIESLIPLKDEPDHKPEPAPSEEYKKHLQENRELIEAVTLKNKQLREVIDRIRIIIWEINTMLSMRRS